MSSSSASSSIAPSNETTAAALQRYSAFVEEVLKPQLTQTLAKRDALTREMNEYQELLELVRDLQSKQQPPTRVLEFEETKGDDAAVAAASSKPKALHVLMDLGQKFQVHAKIPDPSMITVDIGLNFHVEMTLDEARQFVNRHLVHLAQRRDDWQHKARQVSEHVNVVIESIQKLVALQHA